MLVYWGWTGANAPLEALLQIAWHAQPCGPAILWHLSPVRVCLFYCVDGLLDHQFVQLVALVGSRPEF